MTRTHIISFDALILVSQFNVVIARGCNGEARLSRAIFTYLTMHYLTTITLYAKKVIGCGHLLKPKNCCVGIL